MSEAHSIDHIASMAELGRRLEAAWQREKDAWAAVKNTPDDSAEQRAAEAANDATDAIVKQILETRATTLEGLKGTSNNSTFRT